MASRVQVPVSGFRRSYVLSAAETVLGKIAQRAQLALGQLEQLKLKNNSKVSSSRQNGKSSIDIRNITAFNDQIATLDFDDLPPNSLLLGVCSDGLPLRVDLDNPVAGSILISGDPGSGKTQLLKSILSSIFSFEPITELTISIITHDPQDFDEISQTPYCQDISNLVHRNARQIIRALMSESDQRRNDPDGPIRILLVDDLARLLQSVDDETFGFLYRLIKHGPRYHIWTIASLSTRYAEYLNQRLLDAFRTHIIGHIDDLRIAEILGRDSGMLAQRLVSPNNFIASLGLDWVPFESPKNVFADAVQEDRILLQKASGTKELDTMFPNGKNENNEANPILYEQNTEIDLSKKGDSR